MGCPALLLIRSAGKESVLERKGTSMKMLRRYEISTAIALILILGGAMAAAAQFKNSTPIPPSVPAPDKIETPFGTVHLDDGFPNKESADKIYNMLDLQRAVRG